MRAALATRLLGDPLCSGRAAAWFPLVVRRLLSRMSSAAARSVNGLVLCAQERSLMVVQTTTELVLNQLGETWRSACP